MKTSNKAMLRKSRSRQFLPFLVLTLALLSEISFAVGPNNRIFPHRPNPPGPNNPIGPNNPAISNPLSSLNPSTPFSNNQIVLRQLLSTQQLAGSGSTAGFKSAYAYAIAPSYGVRTALPYERKIPADYRLLLNNRTVFSVSHPIVLERPDPLTPLSNHYAVINNQYFAISHDPANDSLLFQSWVPSLK